MSNAQHEFVSLAGGRITCFRCQAMARSGKQCQKAAVRGKRVCRSHGGASTGPRTQEGRDRIAAAHRKHGNRSAKAAAMSVRLRELEEALWLLGALTGPHTPGRRPADARAIGTLEAVQTLVLESLIPGE